MVALAHRKYITPDEYLDLERDAEFKSEYDDGVIVAMAGGSPEHSIIAFNFGAALAPYLRQFGCQGYTPDMRVRIEISNRFYYPDFTAVCGQPQYLKQRRTADLLNPTLLVEVLSRTSERRDRGTKWFAYQTLESLQVYLLVRQDEPFVEWFARTSDSEAWEYRSVRGISSSMTVRFAGRTIELQLSDLYFGVEFPAPAASDAADMLEDDDE